ncbi:MAG: SpoIID/LytB domain-containing protein [Lachnospiraceae bacterium]|nr:SpoIID/LytB domain-containing protein [Lachnospiraceae bacterium]
MMIVMSGIGVYTKAANTKAAQYVRVGISNYNYSSKVSLKNKKVALGYGTKTGFKEELRLESTSGFTFQPVLKSYMVSNTEYKTYATANSLVKKLKKQGAKAYVGILYHNKYKVYVNQSTYAKVQGLFGISYTKNNKKYLTSVKGSENTLFIDVYKSKGYPQFAGLNSSGGTTTITVNKKKYRGRMEIGRYNKDSLTVVNVANVEDYLKGVIACEMVDTWEMEALKAQAVCSRSLAYDMAGYTAVSNSDKAYKMDDTTSCQVYGGVARETKRTSQAVKATKGKRVYYKGKVVPAYFFSTSGGATEEMKYVWGGSAGYLKSVLDPEERFPEKEPWIYSFTKSNIKSRVGGIGNIKSVKVSTYTKSGRAYKVKVTGASGSKTLVKQQGRTTFGLPSNKFKVINYGDKPDQVSVESAGGTTTKKISSCYTISGSGTVKKSSSKLEQYIAISDKTMTNFPRKAPASKNTVYLAGMGFGHGVGMSQSGANGLAMKGYDYEDIIRHYFTDVVVK